MASDFADVIYVRNVLPGGSQDPIPMPDYHPTANASYNRTFDALRHGRPQPPTASVVLTSDLTSTRQWRMLNAFVLFFFAPIIRLLFAILAVLAVGCMFAGSYDFGIAFSVGAYFCKLCLSVYEELLLSVTSAELRV
jgi:hypothetical protein